MTVIVGIVALLDPSVEHYASQHPGQAFAGVLVLVVGAILSPNRPTASTTQTTVETTTQTSAASPKPAAPSGKK